jgi:hypothetical protein
MQTGLMAGAAVAAANALAAALLLRWALTKRGSLAMQIIMGGMVVRLFAVGAVCLMVLVLCEVDRVAFIGSLFTGYCIFLIIEIVFVHRRLGSGSGGDSA